MPRTTRQELAGDARLRAARAAAYENPRPEIQALVPMSARRIFDVGCSSGVLGEALKRRQQVEVVGVEIDPAYVEDAAHRLDRVIAADIEELAARSDIEHDLGQFDCLIAGDVLEHLRDPWTVLRRIATLLLPGGRAVVSLPNVRYWETFWQLGWHGTWPRRDEGIFDRTHLRWFTGRDAAALFDHAGLDVLAIHPQYRLKPYVSRWDSLAARLGRTPLRPFLVFQYVLAGSRRTR